MIEECLDRTEEFITYYRNNEIDGSLYSDEQIKQAIQKEGECLKDIEIDVALLNFRLHFPLPGERRRIDDAPPQIFELQRDFVNIKYDGKPDISPEEESSFEREIRAYAQAHTLFSALSELSLNEASVVPETYELKDGRNITFSPNSIGEDVPPSVWSLSVREGVESELRESWKLKHFTGTPQDYDNLQSCANARSIYEHEPEQLHEELESKGLSLDVCDALVESSGVMSIPEIPQEYISKLRQASPG